MRRFAIFKCNFSLYFFGMALLLSGCGSAVASTPTVEKLATSTMIPPTATPSLTFTPTGTPTFTLTPTSTFTATLTPTETYTPTSTFTPTLTPIPDILGNIAPEFDMNDFSVTSGQFQLQITEILSLKNINNGEYTPDAGNHYLVLHGYLYNYSEQDQNFSELDFQADFNQVDNVTPRTDLMYALKQTQYPDAGYPERNFFGSPKFNVPANRAVEVILAYEAPVTVDYMKLYFNPGGVQPRSSMGILLFKQADTNQYALLKESIDGNTRFTVEFADITAGTFEELIDRQIEVIDNCFNDEARSKSLTYEQSEAFEITLGTQKTINLDASRYFLSVAFNGLLNYSIAQHHEKTNTNELTISQTENLTAAPHKKTVWEFQAYKVSLSGTMVVKFGEQSFEVPYTISDRLRVEVISLPADPCPVFTTTP